MFEIKSDKLTYVCLESLQSNKKAQVFRAIRKQPRCQLGEEVILKFFENQQQMQLEFESLKRGMSEYSVNVLGFETFKSKPALVLESIKGCSLKELLLAFRLTESEVQILLIQIYQGLMDLKNKDLLHADLSLSNILVNTEGKIKFIDYGKANYKNKIQGTHPFIAPEVLKGSRPSFLSDLFSLGVIELFLKEPHKIQSLESQGSTFFVNKNSNLLNEDPKKRFFPLKKDLCEYDFTSLQVKIKTCESYSKERNQRTMEIPSNSKPWIFKLVLTSFLFFGLSGSTSFTKKGLLHIQTHKWFYVQVNGFQAYTPFQISLPEGWHTLKWRSLNSKGKSFVYISEKNKKFISDKDLTQ